MSSQNTIDINVPVLARVEGEGALDLHIQDARIHELKLRIFEAPRLFEKFLEGRSYLEVPDIVARICGICPVAYQMSAVQALEGLFGVDPGPWVRAMRRAFYCGEWMESHALHIHLLAAPDFLGYDSVMSMAADYPEVVRRGLGLQALGNDLIRLLGARSVHPVGVRVGGFHHAPEPSQVSALRDRLEAALSDADALVDWTLSLPLPEDRQAFTSVALRHGEEYPMNAGRLVSDAGLDVEINAFEQHFQERQVPHTSALHCLLDGRPYLVGPLARMNLNHDRLPASLQQRLSSSATQWPSSNVFHSIVARAVEIRYALGEAIRLLDGYQQPETPFVTATPLAGTATGCTEAPRGILWHRYDMDASGGVTHARIVPPTSQNQARMEEDLRASLEAYGLEHEEQALRHRAETVIRNYDPCISCATHFLRLNLERS